MANTEFQEAISDARLALLTALNLSTDENEINQIADMREALLTFYCKYVPSPDD